MKKLFAPTNATPSVIYLFKGIYLTFLLMFITTFSFSQNNNWEIGIGLRPLTLKEYPYSIIVKKYLSSRSALRLGISAVYNQKDERHTYTRGANTDDYYVDYEYDRVDKNLYTSSFIGIQYGKRKNDFYCYAATDFSFNYKLEKGNLPNGILYRSHKLSLGEYIETARFSKKNKFEYGLKQSVGIQYVISPSFSVSLESGIYYQVNRTKRKDYSYSLYRSEIPLDVVGVISASETPVKELSHQLGFSILSFLIFNYHFKK